MNLDVLPPAQPIQAFDKKGDVFLSVCQAGNPGRGKTACSRMVSELQSLDLCPAITLVNL